MNLLNTTIVQLRETPPTLSYVFDDSVVPDLKDIIYGVGVQYGGATAWNFMWQRYEAATVPSEKGKTLHALAATTDAVTLQRLFVSTVN